MPSSRPNATSTTVHVVRQLDPASILDVDRLRRRGA
jgi:hypothetical protein